MSDSYYVIYGKDGEPYSFEIGDRNKAIGYLLSNGVRFHRALEAIDVCPVAEIECDGLVVTFQGDGVMRHLLSP